MPLYPPLVRHSYNSTQSGDLEYCNNDVTMLQWYNSGQIDIVKRLNITMEDRLVMLPVSIISQCLII